MSGNLILKDKINESVNNYKYENFSEAVNEIQTVIDEAVKNSDKETLAVCLALKSLYSYYAKDKPFLKVMQELENAKFLSESINSQTGKDNVNFIYSTILYAEKDYEMAKKYLLSVKDPQNILLNYENFKNGFLSAPNEFSNGSNPMIALLNIAKTISSNTNIDTLLKTIADETTYSLNAERCSVFILDKETKELWSKVATGIDFKEIRFPMDKGLAGHVAMTGETVNIKDAYSDKRFNKSIDMQTGYHTRNILCMPIRNMHFEIIGVLQVLNKNGDCFSEYDEKLLVTIGMNAGIAIENSRLFEKQQQMLEQQKQLFSSFVDTLVASIDARDKITSGHSSRVKLYAQLICEYMGIDENQASLIEQAAILHDIGKIGIRDSVLQKEGKLTPEEYSHIQEHAKITYDILSKIYNTKDTEQIALIAASHHEKYNGQGYYRGLKGEEIPLGGRILAVADVFDAITSKRHYRDKMPIKNVISILIEDSGSHFDPEITKNFLSIECDKIVEILADETRKVLSEQEQKILCKLNMYQFYDILNKEDSDLTDFEKLFKQTFDKYYQQ